MGKERFIEAGRQGLRSTKEFVNTKPKTILLGLVSIAGAFSGSGLGLGIVNGNETAIIVNTITLGMDAGLAGVALKLKNSKSVHQQSHSPSTPEN